MTMHVQNSTISQLCFKFSDQCPHGPFIPSMLFIWLVLNAFNKKGPRKHCWGHWKPWSTFNTKYLRLINENWTSLSLTWGFGLWSQCFKPLGHQWSPFLGLHYMRSNQWWFSISVYNLIKTLLVLTIFFAPVYNTPIKFEN